MADANGVLIKALQTYLTSNVTGIVAVNAEWPSGNVPLTMPCITILTKSEKLTPQTAEVLTTGSIALNQATVKYVVGEWDLALELQLWAKSKQERQDFIEKIFNALNPSMEVMGVNLHLTDYHNEYASVAMTDRMFPDSEETSQRQEWRCIISLVANVNAIRSKSEYIMTQDPETTALTLETPDEIDDE